MIGDVHFVEGEAHRPAEILLRYAGGFALLSVQHDGRERTIACAFSKRPQTGTWHYAEREAAAARSGR